MQAVSEAYKRAMALPFRGPGHARFDLGVRDESVTGTATGRYYAGYDTGVAVGGDVMIKTSRYAGLDLFCVDGSMILPANDGNGNPVFKTDGIDAVGAISKDVLATKDESGYWTWSGLDIKLNTWGSGESSKWNGLTLIFDEVYPTRVQILDGYSTTRTYRLNSPVLRINESFSTNRMNLVFSSPSRQHTRIRLQGIVFGFYARYEDDDILKISWSESANPVSAEFPNMDADVTLQDNENLFDPDKENSLIYMIDTMGKMSLDFGVTLEDNTVEWLHMMNGVVASWTYSKGSLSLKCTDFFRDSEDTVSMTYKDYTGRTKPDATLAKGSNEMSASVPAFTHFPLNALVGYAMSQTGLLEYAEEGATEKDANYSALTSGIVFRAVNVRGIKEILQSAANVSRAMLYLDRSGRLKMERIEGKEAVYNLSHEDILQLSDVSSPEKVKTLSVSLGGYNDAQKDTSVTHMILAYRYNTIVKNHDSRYGDDQTLHIKTDEPISSVTVKLYNNSQSFVFNHEDGEVLDKLPNDAYVFDLSAYSDLKGVTMNVDLREISITFDADHELSFDDDGVYFDIEIKTLKEFTTSELYNVNDRGRQETWSNFLISTGGRRDTVAEWLVNHFLNYQQFEYDYRGNPELDAGDIIYQQSPFGGESYRKVVILSNQIDYDGSFTGHLCTKEVG